MFSRARYLDLRIQVCVSQLFRIRKLIRLEGSLAYKIVDFAIKEFSFADLFRYMGDRLRNRLLGRRNALHQVLVPEETAGPR